MYKFKINGFTNPSLYELTKSNYTEEQIHEVLWNVVEEQHDLSMYSIDMSIESMKKLLTFQRISREYDTYLQTNQNNYLTLFGI